MVGTGDIWHNFFNSFLSSLLSPVYQVHIYLTSRCWQIIIKGNKIINSGLVVFTKLNKKTLKLFIYFIVIGNAVDKFLSKPTFLEAVSYCFCKWIAFAMLTSCIISEAFLPSSVREITYFRSPFLYLYLNALIMPVSSDCNREVVHFGRKISLTFLKLFRSVLGWHGTLSIKRMISLRSSWTLRSRSLSIRIFFDSHFWRCPL